LPGPSVQWVTTPPQPAMGLREAPLALSLPLALEVVAVVSSGVGKLRGVRPPPLEVAAACVMVGGGPVGPRDSALDTRTLRKWDSGVLGPLSRSSMDCPGTIDTVEEEVEGSGGSLSATGRGGGGGLRVLTTNPVPARTGGRPRTTASSPCVVLSTSASVPRHGVLGPCDPVLPSSWAASWAASVVPSPLSVPAVMGLLVQSRHARLVPEARWMSPESPDCGRPGPINQRHSTMTAHSEHTEHHGTNEGMPINVTDNLNITGCLAQRH
jgi:hypothetical protein